MKAFALAILACLASVPASWAAPAMQMRTAAPVIQVDWQEPLSLPRRFRNHCFTDALSGRPYCSDHCGSGYQIYFCSPRSFGCCRVGFGYCDWNGSLRCHP